jgi:outer membrane lipoprotein SlyB
MKRKHSPMTQATSGIPSEAVLHTCPNVFPFKLTMLMLLLSACASDKAIIDRRGVDMKQYAADYEDCQAYAAEVDSGRQVAKSAGVGAIVGGSIGAIFGDSGAAARGAGVGAVQGGTSGGLRADRESHRVLLNCLRGRGYKVLN